MFNSIQKSFRQFFIICALVGGLLGGALSAAEQTTTQFTYQGRLTDGAMPANGNYDMQFQVCANADCTFVFGSPVAMSPVPVTNGIFTVTLDFGDVFSGFGTLRYLKIGVRQTGNAGAYTTLSPAQRITAAPGAIRSQQSNNADALGNVAANQYVQTGDARLFDARAPTAGSDFYIRNNSSATGQNSDFYITGTGRVGNLTVNGNVSFGGTISGNGQALSSLNASNITAGTLNTAQIPNLSAAKITTGTFSDALLSSNVPRLNASNTFSGTQTAGIFNATGQFNLGGNRIFSSPGATNLFAGFGAGGTSSTGASNSFFGTSAGAANTSGAENVLVGREAGLANTTGSDNTFIGTGAGGNNTTGSNNTLIGAGARLFSNDLTYATAIGAGTVVTGSNNISIGRVTFGNNLSYSDSVEINATDFCVGCYYNSATRGAHSISLTSDSIYIGANGGSDTNTKIEIQGELNVTRINFGIFGGGSSDPICYSQSGLGNKTLGYCSSSIRYKKDVESFSSGLDLVKHLRPVTFTWKSNNQRDLGFVAEEVNAVEPLMTTYNDKGEVEGVKDDRISAALVNAVNEQQTQIETQKTQIETQRKTIERQQRQIDAFVKLTCATNPSADVCRPEEK